MQENILITRQKATFEAEVVHIKETVSIISRSFPELELQKEGTTEEVVQQTTDLVQTLQLKVVELEAHAVPSTPPEVRDQQKIEV